MPEMAKILLAFSGISVLLIVLIGFAINRYYNDKLSCQFKMRLAEEEKQKEILTALVKGQENEQRRIASDLQDGLAVEIASVNSFIHHLRPYLITTDIANNKFETITTLIDQLYANTKKISTELLPSGIEKFGLAAALEDFVKRLNTSGNVTVKFVLEKEYERVAADKELLIYRIVQELIKNALKHSNATEITIKLICDAFLKKVEVNDNGVGFNQAKASGVGIKSIEARIKLLNGEFILQSYQHLGTSAVILF